jgi:RsiW-degrading membrane proteinase PrsW (M82 family)
MPQSRHSSWLIAGFLFAIACVLGLLVLLATGLDTGFAGFAIGLLMAVVPVPFYVALALWIDRFEPEPPFVLGVAFLWGASIATFFAMIFNTVHEGLLTALAGPQSASMLTTVLSAPIVEEVAKGSALLLLFVWKRDEFDDVTDGIIYATMVGLGFAMTENIQYYGRALATQGGGTAATVFFLRGILGPFAHPLYTSMTGIGFGFARESNRKQVKVLAPIAGLLAAILFHGIWNLSASYGAVFFAAYFLVMVPAVIGVLLIAIFSLRREARMIRAQLEQVVAWGVLSAEDVNIVTSVPRRLQASSNALFRGGYRQWVERRRFHALATELAFHSWRASRALQDDVSATHAQLIDQVRASRARLGLAT